MEGYPQAQRHGRDYSRCAGRRSWTLLERPSGFLVASDLMTFRTRSDLGSSTSPMSPLQDPRLSRRYLRRLLAQGRRLGFRRHARCLTRHCAIGEDYRCTTAEASQLDPSLGSRRAIRLHPLSPEARWVRHRHQHEQARQSLQHCQGGEHNENTRTSRSTARLSPASTVHVAASTTSSQKSITTSACTRRSDISHLLQFERVSQGRGHWQPGSSAARRVTRASASVRQLPR